MRRATVSPVIFPHPPFCLYLTGNLSVCSSRNGYRTLLNGFLRKRSTEEEGQEEESTPPEEEQKRMPSILRKIRSRLQR